MRLGDGHQDHPGILTIQNLRHLHDVVARRLFDFELSNRLLKNSMVATVWFII